MRLIALLVGTMLLLSGCRHSGEKCLHRRLQPIPAGKTVTLISVCDRWATVTPVGGQR